MDCRTPPGSSVHEIFQARILEWVVISFSRGSLQPRDQTRVSWTVGRFFTNWATREAQTDVKAIVNQVWITVPSNLFWDGSLFSGLVYSSFWLFCCHKYNMYLYAEESVTTNDILKKLISSTCIFRTFIFFQWWWTIFLRLSRVILVFINKSLSSSSSVFPGHITDPNFYWKHDFFFPMITSLLGWCFSVVLRRKLLSC